MNKQRSHLIPTLVMDKNGKQTTVHKKPLDVAATISGIPPVTIAPKLTDDHAKAVFLDKLEYVDPERLPDDYELINGIDSTVIPYVSDLMTRGSESAQNAALSYLNEEIDYMNDQIDAYSDIDRTEGQALVVKAVTAELKANTLAVWHVGAMADELEIEFDIYTVIQIASIIHARMHSTPHEAQTLEDHAYWRGLGIFILSDPNTLTRDANDFPSDKNFVRWAGGHDQPLAIHRLAVEYATTDVASLEDLLTQTKTTAQSLVDGIL